MIFKKSKTMERVIELTKISIYAFFAWLNIDVEVFSVLMIFLVADSILGAVKAVRLGHEFKFKTMLWGLCLKLCFLIIPMVVALLGKGLGGDFSIAVNVVMKILTVSEAYSILGNIYAAKNKVEVKRLDIISMVLKSMRIALRNMIDKGLKILENLGGKEFNKIEDEETRKDD